MNFNIYNTLSQADILIKHLVYENVRIEALDISIFDQTEKDLYHSFGSDKRKIEFYFTRLLWRSFESHCPIQYNENGKPQISRGFISISHSKNVVAIAYSNLYDIGIDVEHPNKKIALIKNKFLSDNEVNLFDLDDELTLTSLWSLKEAVYKLADIRGLSFKDSILIEQVGDTNRIRLKTAEKNELLEFKRLIKDDFIITFGYRNPTPVKA